MFVLLNVVMRAAGSMNFDEFLQLLLDKRRLTDPDADIRDAFRLFDKDSDGYLTVKDLKQVLKIFIHHNNGSIIVYRFTVALICDFRVQRAAENTF